MKRGDRARVWSGTGRDPRPRGRGHVEATSRAPQPPLPTFDPRPRGRGHVEASTSDRARVGASPSIPVREDGATLKRVHGAPCSSAWAAIPVREDGATLKQGERREGRVLEHPIPVREDENALKPRCGPDGRWGTVADPRPRGRGHVEACSDLPERDRRAAIPVREDGATLKHALDVAPRRVDAHDPRPRGRGHVEANWTPEAPSSSGSSIPVREDGATLKLLVLRRLRAVLRGFDPRPRGRGHVEAWRRASQRGSGRARSPSARTGPR